jgi:hypothetical protein
MYGMSSGSVSRSRILSPPWSISATALAATPGAGSGWRTTLSGTLLPLDFADGVSILTTTAPCLIHPSHQLILPSG